MAKLLSGRVGVTSFAGLSTDRQQTTGFPSFLSLEETEPNLGLPSNNDYVLYGDINGKRYWAAPSGAASGAVDGVTIQEQGVTPAGYAGSITTLNFKGNGVDVSEAKYSGGSGIELGISTITINKSANDIQDANEFTRVTGVTTFRVGYGLSFMEIPVGQFSSGIVSIFNVADSKVDFQDDTGQTSYQDVTIMRIGYGLTITQPSAGIASISPTGQFEYINATGIATASSFVGPVTGNVTGNVTGDVTGDTTGHHTGTFYSTGISTASQLNGSLKSGLSTITQLQTSTINATGIITTSAGFLAPAGSFGFSGSLNSSGISTVAFFSGTNISISGIATADGGFVAPSSSQGFVGKLVGSHTGDIYGTGISTIPTLHATNINATTFTGNLTGSASLVDLTVEQGSADPSNSILFTNNPSGSQAVKTSTALTFDANAGVMTCTKYSGDGSMLTNLPAAQLTGALPNIDGSSLNNVVTSAVDLTATNATAAEHYILFADSPTGVEQVRTDTELKWNPSTNTLTAAAFNGSCTGLTGDPNITVTDITLKGDIVPDSDATRNLGSLTYRMANVYTADMHFNNEGINNSIDGTWGHWTLQEGDENIFMINQRSGKKYKINLTEV